ncbi:equilibrative nucleobase transporter 1-like [Dermatophagoides pteronyssinus]|uniref:equilibrative nucleobase transporter 1-like n=1 Tax=Dermatophagoides pteronyssinus TaxID=6956 RepID=UPI003F66E578
MYESEWKRFLVVVFGLLEILIFSGTILGWTSLKLMLKNEGIYDYLCNDINNNSSTTKTIPSSSSVIIDKDNDDNDEMLMTSESNKQNILPFTNSAIPINPKSFSSTSSTIRRLPKNFTLKVNFTLINNDSYNNNVNNTDNGNDDQTVIVIPFETQGTYNHSFIYQLLNDSSLILKSNGNDNFGDIKLVTDPSKTKSTFENYLDLYLRENFQPSLSSTIMNQGCKQQEVTLNLAFSIGSFCMGAAAFIWGFLLEKLGLKTVRLIINAMFALGAFILCFIARGRDWLLFPALLIMSLSGVPIRIANMQISNLYPSKRSTIISIYSGAFSASSIIYVILQYIYDNSGRNFFWIQLILVVLSLLTIPFTLFVLPSDKVREPDNNNNNKKNNNPISNDDFTKSHQQNKATYYPANIDGLLFSNKKSSSSEEIKPSIQLQNFKTIGSPTLMRKKVNNGFVNDAFEPDNQSIENVNQSTHSLSPVLKKSPPLRISLRTIPYNLHQLWFSWMITYMVMYVGSLDLWTKRVTEDRSSQTLFLNLYGVVQVLALVVSPIAGLLMDWQLSKTINEKDELEKRVQQAQSGFWPLFITSFTLLICVLCHYFDREEFIYASIVFVTIYRSFLLAVGSAFLRIRFHADHFNQLLGIMSSISAVISLLQIPLYSWEKNSESNVIYVNIVNTAIAFVIMSNPIYLLITPLQRYFIRKENDQLTKFLNY